MHFLCCRIVCDAFSVLGNYNISVEKVKVTILMSSLGTSIVSLCNNYIILAIGPEGNSWEGDVISDVQCSLPPSVPPPLSLGQHCGEQGCLPSVQGEGQREGGRERREGRERDMWEGGVGIKF